MTLYEITGQFMELLEMAQEGVLDRETIEDTLEGVEFEFEEKADAYAKVVNSLNADVNAIDKEIKRLTERKDMISNNAKRIKESLERAMIETGKTRFKTALFGFGIQKNPPSVVIDDETAVPDAYYIPQEPKFDKAAIKKFLKENKVPWAHLQWTESLRIR